LALEIRTAQWPSKDPVGDPSFTAPIFANRFDDEDGEGLAGLRLDQSIEEAIRCARPDRADIKGNVANIESPRRLASEFDSDAGPVLAASGSPASETTVRLHASIHASHWPGLPDVDIWSLPL
jgi:hypothetical protein